jgi:AcrR family transcriptional regulator
MMTAMADAMTERGYVGTTVGDVLARAGVSRETFYQQFSSKLDCFMSAFDAAAAVLFAKVRKVQASPTSSSRLDDFDALFTAYLDSLAAEPADTTSPRRASIGTCASSASTTSSSPCRAVVRTRRSPSTKGCSASRKCRSLRTWPPGVAAGSNVAT